MSSYYFASRYSRHPEMRTYRAALVEAIPGAVVTSRWIDCHNEELEASYTPEALNADPAGCWRHGSADLDDLELADVLVSFTGPGGKGGRHIEHGYFLAMQLRLGYSLRVVIVGPRENIFHCEPCTEQFADFDSFLAAEKRRGADQVDARPAAAFASITRAAEYAGVSTKTVRRWIAQGRIAGYRLGRRLIRVDLNEVDGLMHRIPTSSGVPAA